MTDDDLLSWLTARLDETEATARAAEMDAASPWFVRGREGLVRHSGPPDEHYKGDGLWDSEDCTEEWHQLCMNGPVARHVAAHDPAAVLADVEAKRAIAALHSGAHECSTYYTLGGETQINNSAWITDDEDCSTVQLLASCYRHHPGWRAEWAPETRL